MSLKELLINQSFDNNKVDIFCSYVNRLKTEVDSQGKLLNYWAAKLPDDKFADAFKSVYSTGLFVDGDSITLTYRKKLVITYDYHAYKNKILLSYPETIFDFQVVYEGDSFTFKKESGKVFYTHVMNNPFETKKEIIGAYGVIKNKRGEFIELINKDDIQKMRNTSKMKNIWNTWLDRMVLKSVIKRICAVHFKDVTKEIDTVDNEQNDPIRAEFPPELLEIIDNAETIDELNKIYNANIKSVSDQKAFIDLLGKRKKEVKNDSHS